jgi:beta-phosphoglucomutase-like phosphatase (HAD superfamily)
MVEAVLSDIDGTLVESNWLHAAASRDAFAVIDIPLDIETLRKQIGKGGDQLMECKLSPQPSMEKYG